MVHVVMLAVFFLFVLPAPAQQEPAPVPPENLKDRQFEVTAEFRSLSVGNPQSILFVIEEAAHAVEKARADFAKVRELSDELDALASQEKRDEARERELEKKLMDAVKALVEDSVPAVRGKVTPDLADRVAAFVKVSIETPRDPWGYNNRKLRNLDEAAGVVRFQLTRLMSGLEEALTALEKRAKTFRELLAYRDAVLAGSRLCRMLEGLTGDLNKVSGGLEDRRPAGTANLPSGVEGKLGPRTRETLKQLQEAAGKPAPEPPKEKKEK